MTFAGLSAFPITPTDEDGHVREAELCQLLKRLMAADIQSIGLLGSTGGYAYLSRSQRRATIEVAVDCVAGKLPLIVGIGALRTDMTIALAQDAEQSGANALLLAPVSYTPLLDDEVFEHYAAVAKATSLPLCIYNNPGTTHFRFTTALLARLAGLQNVAAVKMPLPADESLDANLQGLRHALPPGFAIGYSGDWGCPQALLDGADAWYSVIAGILPKPTLRLANAARGGRIDEVRSIGADFQPMWALFKEFGGLRVTYAIARLLEITEASPPRPILPLGAHDVARVNMALASLRTADAAPAII